MDNQDFFTVEATISYRPLRVPPRCRKARHVTETFEHRFHVPVVASEAAPVAAWIPDRATGEESEQDKGTTLRVHDGQLLQAMIDTSTGQVVQAGSPAFPAAVYHRAGTEIMSQAVAEARQQYAGAVIVGDEVWLPAEEPVYVVHHFGMGRNHGGTSLDIEMCKRPGYDDRTFSLLEPDTAIEVALQMAEHVGDDRSFDRIRQPRRATIYVPSAFQHPLRADRLKEASEGIRDLVGVAIGRLSETISQYEVELAIEILTSARKMMLQHGIEKVSIEPED